MEKKVAGIVGALGALAIGPQLAHAAPAANPPDPLRVESYAELLNPIANASELLRLADSSSSERAKVETAQYHHYRRHHHDHHHHHHHSAFFDGSKFS